MTAPSSLDQMEKHTKDQRKRLQKIAAKQLKKYSKIAKKSDHEHKRHEAEKNIEIIARHFGWPSGASKAFWRR